MVTSLTFGYYFLICSPENFGTRVMDTASLFPSTNPPVFWNRLLSWSKLISMDADVRLTASWAHAGLMLKEAILGLSSLSSFLLSSAILILVHWVTGVINGLVKKGPSFINFFSGILVNFIIPWCTGSLLWFVGLHSCSFSVASVNCFKQYVIYSQHHCPEVQSLF